MVFSLADERVLASASHITVVLTIWHGTRALWRWCKGSRAAKRREVIKEFAFWMEKKRRAEEVTLFTPPTSFEPLSQYEPTCDRHFPMGCRRRACRRIVHTASQASSFLLISSPLETWSLRPFGKRFKVYSRCIGRKITWRVQLLISLIAPVLFFNPNFLQDPCT